MSLASSRRSSGSSSSVTSDELGAPEQPGRGEGWQLPKPTNGERNVFGHINIGIGLLKKRLFAPQRLSEGPTIRRSDAAKLSSDLPSPVGISVRDEISSPISLSVADGGGRRTTFNNIVRHVKTLDRNKQWWMFLFLFFFSQKRTILKWDSTYRKDITEQTSKTYFEILIKEYVLCKRVSRLRIKKKKKITFLKTKSRDSKTSRWCFHFGFPREKV